MEKQELHYVNEAVQRRLDVTADNKEKLFQCKASNSKRLFELDNKYLKEFDTLVIDALELGQMKHFLNIEHL